MAPTKKLSAKKMRNVGKVSIRAMNGPASATEEYACSLADPFSCSACIPDGARGIGCFSVKQDFSFTTGAAGTANLLAWSTYFDANSYSDTAGTNANPQVTGNWSAATARTTIASLYKFFRPVSSGIRCTYVGNTQTDSGILLIGQVSPGVHLDAFHNGSLTTATGLMETYKIYPLRNGGICSWRPLDESSTCEFQTIGTGTVAVGATLNLPYLVAIVYGAQSTQATLHVEAVTNYEGTFFSQTFLPGGLSDAKPADAEVGFFVRAKNMIASVPQIVPLVGNVVAGALTGGWAGAGKAAMGGLISLANGLAAPGKLSQTGLPAPKARLRLLG